jgi:ferritin-like protein
VVSGEPRSRRQLLRAAGGSVAAATVFTAGCGATRLSVKVQGATKVAPGDVGILNGLLDLEHHAIAAYAAGIPLLRHPDAKPAKQFLEQELAHAGALAQLVTNAKAKPAQPRASYDLGNPRSAADVLLLLHRLETGQLAAYISMIPRLSPGRIRSAVAAIFANDAQHVAFLRSQLGRTPVPAAFVTGGE